MSLLKRLLLTVSVAILIILSGTLALSIHAARQYLDGAVDGEPHLLLDGVRSARVAYFGHGQWSDGWDGGVGRLPADPGLGPGGRDRRDGQADR